MERELLIVNQDFTPFVRTVLGDIAPQALGRCDAHEHVIIDDKFIQSEFPEFVLDDVDVACVDVAEFAQAGGGAMVDTMPMGCGRNAEKMAAVSQRTGCHLVIPTGLHLAIYYPTSHWTRNASVDQMVQWFCNDVEVGIAKDESRRPEQGDVNRTKIRAGVIKVAGSNRLTDFEKKTFQAAAITQRRTGCPIITHTEAGRGAMQQVEWLSRQGAELSHVTLSHVDRIADPGPHRECLAAGVRLEYDGHFRWKNEDPHSNPTVQLIAELAFEFPDQIMVGMDAARRSYWHGYGGQPGLAWLLTTLPEMLEAAGVGKAMQDKIYRSNPARAFSFLPPHRES